MQLSSYAIVFGLLLITPKGWKTNYHLNTFDLCNDLCWNIVSKVEGSATRCSKYNSHVKIREIYEYDTEYIISYVIIQSINTL